MAKRNGAGSILVRMRQNWQIYLLLLLPLAWYLIFAYYPMAGLQLAFKSYHAKKGIWGSAWTGFENYTLLFRDVLFWKAVWRTIVINLGRLFICFPFPILLALTINEARIGKVKKFIQPVFTFPYFLSWVVVASVMINLFSVDGLFNMLWSSLTGSTANILGSEDLFQPMLYITDIWKNAGYSAIIYLSAISGIDQEQYEAAQIDGATRLQTVFRITLPNLYPTIAILFILTSGSLMTQGFDQVFNLSNSVTKRVAEILDMYIYRVTFQSSTNLGYSSAAALFRSLVNMLFLLITNKVSKLLGGGGIFG